MITESLEAYINKSHTAKTAKTYLYYISVFLIRRPDAHKLQYADLINYTADLRKSMNNPGALSPHLSAIKRYYDYLIVTGQRSDHPCKGINTKRKKQPIQLQDLFSPAELEALMNRENRFKHLYLRNKVIISLLIYQGLVCSEICNLHIKHIDEDKGTVYIKGSKRTDERTLNLKPQQAVLIHKYIQSSREALLKVNTDCLIITQRGVPETVDDIHSMIEPLKHLYPERTLNPMTIRQSVISNWLNVNKYPLEDVQQWAGHKWPSTTEQYRRKDINDQLKKINMWHPLK